ncbi:CocE/NonD family hydrolase [bacterium AH-315-A03]|nr:CocE/NonD family hydrolase [bacterium AH-315-A03]
MSVEIERDLPVRARDGTILRVDVYRPDNSGACPALLLRTPYSKDTPQTIGYAHPIWYARHGFLVVVGDTRGRFKSEGNFFPLLHEAQDTLDTLDWMRKLPGVRPDRLGMYGYSYSGWTQLLAATHDDSRLSAIAPAFCSAGLYELFFTNGVLNLAFAQSWTLQVALMEAQVRGDRSACAALQEALGDIPGIYSHLPVDEMTVLRTTGLSPFYFEVIQHPERADPYWDSLRAKDQRIAQLNVPTLHIGGWYDTFIAQSTENFQIASDRPNQHLLVGPWYHMPWAQQVGEIDFGEDARSEIDHIQNRWFEHWLQNEGDRPSDLPAVRLFVMGRNSWQDEDSWPPSRSRPLHLFLHSDGLANSSNGDGTLGRNPPTDEPEDIFVYDPNQPVPSLGGSSCCFPELAPMGPRDQRSIEVRNDVLIYTSDVLNSPIEVIGDIQIRLFVATTAATTDFTAKLVDVYPDGRAINIVDSIFRVGSIADQVLEISETIGVTAIVFQEGHRIRLEISSSNFPAYERSLNSVGARDQFDSQVALQRVFHDGDRESSLILPTIN